MNGCLSYCVNHMNVGGNVIVNACLFLHVSPVTDWQPIQGLPCLCQLSPGINSLPLQ